MCEAAPWAGERHGDTHVGEGPPGRGRGGLNAGLRGSRLVVFSGRVGSGYGVLLVYGNASYIRWCSWAGRVTLFGLELFGGDGVGSCCGFVTSFGFTRFRFDRSFGLVRRLFR